MTAAEFVEDARRMSVEIDALIKRRAELLASMREAAREAPENEEGLRVIKQLGEFYGRPWVTWWLSEDGTYTVAVHSDCSWRSDQYPGRTLTEAARAAASRAHTIVRTV